MRVWQPCVNGDRWHLDRETNKSNTKAQCCMVQPLKRTSLWNRSVCWPIAANANILTYGWEVPARMRPPHLPLTRPASAIILVARFGEDSQIALEIQHQNSDKHQHATKHVYKKNLIAAYSLRGPPHTPIKKYFGSSITSQNT